MKLANYNDGGEQNWISFKNEFNYDISELVKALTVNNVKIDIKLKWKLLKNWVFGWIIPKLT